MLRTLTTALAALLLATPLAASAQEVPSYAYAPQVASADEQIRGRIASFDGAYNLTVNDERGYVDNVDLHDGTIINPTGLTLAPGMIVSILGYNDGSEFSANEIDTPYSYDAGVPYYGAHPWNYYGPSVSLSFFFGNLGWWHGNAFQGGYSYRGGARYYNTVDISDIVRASNVEHSGGSYRASGRAVAPRENVAALNRPVAPVQSQVQERRTYANEPRQVIARQPAVQPAIRQPDLNRPVVRLPIMNQPVARQPIARQPVVHQPAAPQVGMRQASPPASAPRAESNHDRGGRVR